MALIIDGSLPVADTENACEQRQRAGFRLTSIKGSKETALGQEVLVNVAEFTPALSTRILNQLKFVPAQAGDKLETIKNAPAQAGWTFVCDAPEMYVESKLERRVVFGKRA